MEEPDLAGAAVQLAWSHLLDTLLASTYQLVTARHPQSFPGSSPPYCPSPTWSHGTWRAEDPPIFLSVDPESSQPFGSAKVGEVGVELVVAVSDVGMEPVGAVVGVGLKLVGLDVPILGCWASPCTLGRWEGGT